MRRTALAIILAAVSVTAPTPAYAEESVFGYVWGNQPSTDSYVADSGYEFNSTGGPVEVTRWAAGRYRVRFAGMGSSGGVAHVQAYGSTSNICTVASWGHGIDVSVNVRCFDTDGDPADTRFVAHFTNRTVPSDTFAYFWAHDATAAGPYQPYPDYAYDSTGMPTSIERTGPGTYRVYLNALSELYPDAHNDGQLQVTAYNSTAVHCGIRVIGDENPTPLGVRCINSGGNPVDSRFVVSYSHGVSHLGFGGTFGNAYIRNHWASAPYVSGWWNSGGIPTVSHPAVGRYQVRFPGLGTGGGHALVNTQELSANHCHIGSWHRDWTTGEQVLNVYCYAGSTGLPADEDFGVSFTA